jgi:histidinol-phosphate aminotransferase
MSGPTPRPGILDIAHYTPGKSKVAGFEHPLKLSANENAFGCSPAARAAYLTAATDLARYPDPSAGALREAIAAHFGLEPERLVFGCGSDELFVLACQAFLEPGDNVVQPAHGFAAWAIAAKACGAEVRNAPERNLTVDVDALLARVDDRTRIVFLADPANPTGTWLPFTEIDRLHAALPSRVLLLLDGAYAEYGRGLDGFSEALDLARGAANIFATRTFSKIYGLAALRVGWGYASEAVIAAMQRIRLPFNVGVPALDAAVAALADQDFVDRSIAHVARWRPVFTQALTELGLEVRPSGTNFVTVGFPDRLGLSAPEVEAGLAARGILVRGLKGYGLPDHLRITIGDDAGNERVLAAAGEIFVTAICPSP